MLNIVLNFYFYRYYQALLQFFDQPQTCLAWNPQSPCTLTWFEEDEIVSTTKLQVKYLSSNASILIIYLEFSS